MKEVLLFNSNVLLGQVEKRSIFLVDFCQFHTNLGISRKRPS